MTGQHPPICDYEGSDYQSSFWDQGGRAYEDGAEAVALKRLLPPSGKLMLEIGAGAGRNTRRYKNFQRIMVMDYSLTQVQQAQERLGRSERYIYTAADVYRLPFAAGLFDAATMIRVIHHLAEPAAALAGIRRVMGSGGIFILEYANKLNLKAILRYLLRCQDWSPFTPESIEFVPLNFDFHPKTIRTLMSDAGFNIERQLTVSHFRIGILKRLMPTAILVGLDSLAQLTGNWWQLSPSVFSRCEAVGDSPQAPPDAIFSCPACNTGDLTEEPGALFCSGCGKAWPIVDGIYDFRG